ncbi:glycosyltransferase family 4 protein [Nodosilinea nodulosa]|uniref:glycosyltransferase family 4 protein n=1 Tax=Nodosilinea nodulosa TaxID=416001 RepID=UPI0004744C59|nr:glycosyltransferase family 4 protein [Nodosilinea nodulosa]
MHILIYSPVFYPSVGGLETVTLILASEFAAQGHTVKLISQTPEAAVKLFNFDIIRRPNALRFIKLVHWCDVFFQPSISLWGVWPLLLCPRPWVASHNNWYCRDNGSLSWQDYAKRFLLRFATNISVSQAIADHISISSIVIPNPYRDDLFKQCPNVVRDRELVFLGRLVSDKGVDLLLDALALLRENGLEPRLTIVGDGPELESLSQQSRGLGLTDQVEFVGVKVGQELVDILNGHQILVVPSRWREPFGIVALEGIACGCVVVGSSGGGLKGAIGDCGITFPNGDKAVLAQVLQQLLTQPALLARYRASAAHHLAKHQKRSIAKAYLQVLEGARL